jgi:hypothetical protein
MSVFLQILEGLLAGIAIGFVYEAGYRILARRLKRKPVYRIRGLRIHHSVYGIIIAAVSLWIRDYFLLALGIGIIIQHILVEKRFTIVDRS